MPETPESTTIQNPGSQTTAFAAMNLDRRLANELQELDYQIATPIQALAIPAALRGADLIACAETGTGKTAAFLLPLLHLLLREDKPKSGVRALILTPTRELCRQVFKQCKQLSSSTHLRTHAVTGGQDFKYQRALFRKNPEIIIATPGRLKEHLEKGATDFDDLEMLVIDEADRMLDMGFEEDVAHIADLCRRERQTLLFSATLEAGRIARHPKFARLLNEPSVIDLSTPSAAALIHQQILLADDDKHKNRLLQKLLQEATQKVLIFTNTRSRANQLAGWLRYAKFDTGLLHGEMDQETRNREMNRLRRGQVKILVATDLASRGLDIDALNLVINYDLARNSEDFIHRTGRTGRAGEQGRAVSLITHSDWDRMAHFQRQLGQEFERIKLPGLEGKFKEPGKLKSSGKRAATSKRESQSTEKTAKPRQKKRLRDRKNIGKRRKPSTAGSTETAKFGDGQAPSPIRKKPDQ